MAPRFLSPAAILVVALLALDVSTAFHPSVPPRPVTTRLEAVSRREALAVSTSAALLAVVPPEALAGGGPTSAKPDYETAAKFYFNGVFRDLKYPQGYRIVAGAVGKAGSVTLQDNPLGEVFDIPMRASKDQETGVITVDMDLSAYRPEYPKSIVATVKKDGCLQFPDGNLWKKDKGVAGLYIDGFAPYPKYRRIVLPRAKGEVAVTMVSGRQVFNVAGVNQGKNTVMVDFPGNKQCPGKFNGKAGTITWLDGNVWTKV